jgi:hypothetical protein
LHSAEGDHEVYYLSIIINKSNNARNLKNERRRSGRDRRAELDQGGDLMAGDIDSNEMSTFKDLLLANSLQIDAVAQLLIEKGIFSKDEFFDMLKRIQTEYEKKGEPIS